MSFSQSMLRPLATFLLLLLAAVAFVIAGCRPQDEIARYTVPKPEVIYPTLVKGATEERQMLGAIVLVDRAGWFFKLTGAKAQVGPLTDAFQAFVKGVKFAGDPAKPSWTVPPGWKERPGSDVRFATLEIPADGKALELTVTTLEMADVDESHYLLSNVNRWRGQLGLGELRASDLASETTSAKVGDYPATFVSIVGTGSGTMTGGPFAGGPFSGDGGPRAGGGPFASSTGPAEHASGQSAGQPKWTRPEGWNEIPPKTFGLAAFSVGQEPKVVEISLSSAGGDWTTNVNRWRGQLGLPAVSPEEIGKEVQTIETLGTRGNYVQLSGVSQRTGAPAALFGVAVSAGGSQYFVKLLGDPELAQREKANFEAFVRSLKFE